jgi:ribose 5-phosphate isomerase
MNTLRLNLGNFPLPIQVYSFSLQKHIRNDKQVCNEKQIRILKKNWQGFTNISFKPKY